MKKIPQELLGYVHQELQKGKSEKEIKETLKEAGWDRVQIERVIREVKEAKKNRRRYRSILKNQESIELPSMAERILGVVFLVGIIILVYLFYYFS